MKKIAFVCAVGMVVAACATPPQEHRIQNSQEYVQSFDETWSNLMDHMTTAQWQIRTIEKDSGIIYAETVRGVPEDMADCGQAPLLQEVDRYGTMNIFVRPMDETRTSVNVNSSFEVVRLSLNGQNRFRHDCSSTGQLERMIFDAARS